MNKIKVLFFIIVIAMISVSFSCSNGADESGAKTETVKEQPADTGKEDSGDDKSGEDTKEGDSSSEDSKESDEEDSSSGDSKENNDGDSSSEKPNSNPEELSIILQPVEVATNTTLTINTSITTSGNVTKVVYKKNGSENAKTLLADTEAIDITENVKTSGKFVISATSEESGNGVYTIAASDDVGRRETVQITVNQFDFTPPDLVTALSADYSNIDNTVTLNWTNPETFDFDHVEIIYTFNDGNTDSQESTAVIVRDISNKVFIVKNGNEVSAKTYKYYVYSVDMLGNKSEATIKSIAVVEGASTGYQFHETVEYLPEGTDGTAGTTGTYVLFGDWPQTIKANNIEIDTTQTITRGDFTYYLGSDQNWYVSQDDNAYEIGYVYSDGTTVGKYPNNSTKYFKVEPIKWRILNPNPVDGEKRILLAEKCLVARQTFDPGNSRTLNGQTIYGNNYRYSNIRAYLNATVNEYVTTKFGENIPTYELVYKNKGFLYSAFTVSAIDKIADTLVKNDLESTGDVSNTYICEDTRDKIFLPSFLEMNNTEYGFSENETRIREATDYAKARGMKLTEGGWLLRSPSRSSASGIYRVNSDGGFYSNNFQTTAPISWESGTGMKYAYAIVPALCLN